MQIPAVFFLIIFSEGMYMWLMKYIQVTQITLKPNISRRLGLNDAVDGLEDQYQDQSPLIHQYLMTFETVFLDYDETTSVTLRSYFLRQIYLYGLVP
jgi:hypothetical protein